jgi:hypothetical protein
MRPTLVRLSFIGRNEIVNRLRSRETVEFPGHYELSQPKGFGGSWGTRSMRGRYYRRSDKQRIAEAFKFGKLLSGFEHSPDYNIAPVPISQLFESALLSPTHARRQ